MESTPPSKFARYFRDVSSSYFRDRQRPSIFSKGLASAATSLRFWRSQSNRKTCLQSFAERIPTFCRNSTVQESLYGAAFVRWHTICLLVANPFPLPAAAACPVPVRGETSSHARSDR